MAPDKKQLVEAMESLADDPSMEDAVERLYQLYRVRRGLQRAANMRGSRKTR